MDLRLPDGSKIFRVGNLKSKLGLTSKTDTSPRLLSWKTKKFRPLFNLRDCICGVHLKSKI